MMIMIINRYSEKNVISDRYISHHISTHNNNNKYKNSDGCRVQIAYFINYNNYNNNVMKSDELHSNTTTTLVCA